MRKRLMSVKFWCFRLFRVSTIYIYIYIYTRLEKKKCERQSMNLEKREGVRIWGRWHFLFWERIPSQLKSFNFLQVLARIVTHGIYLILCGFNECFKTIGFFKMPSVSYLDKNGRILEDLIGKDSLFFSSSKR